MNKFWNYLKNEETGEDELFFDGPISDNTWYNDAITPALFKDELSKHPGNLTVWLNSPGGDVFAASQIYTMLRNHKGKITVKIDGIAASAASVVAMAGDETYISPTGYLMIHNPATIAMGNKADMEQAIALLDEIKEGIINAYMEKSNLSHDRIAKLMDEETWLNAKKAEKYGFVDGILFADKKSAKSPDEDKEDGESKEDTPDEESKEDDEENEEDTPEKKPNNTIRDIPGISFSNTKLYASLSDKLRKEKLTPIVQLEKRLALIK